MVIVDNNILSALAKIDRLALLPKCFEEVSAPVSVFDELAKAEATDTSFVNTIELVKSYNGGWLEIASPTEQELEAASRIRDHALSSTDAQCIAVAIHREQRQLTDDRHVGTVAQQESVNVWDLVLLLQACIRFEVITGRDELSAIIEALAQKDNYQFSEDDRAALRTEWEN